MVKNLSPKIIQKEDDKAYECYESTFSLQSNSREELKNKAINIFLKEKGGYWKDGVKYSTSYKYNVEKTSAGTRIFLIRPAHLNKGMDFTVWIEKLNNGKDKRPSHKDIFNDLDIKKEENQKKFILLLQAIDKVWDCDEPDNILKDTNLSFKNGFSVELLLKTLKWLFIEQDVTYWNYSGRAMLRNGIHKKFANK